MIKDHPSLNFIGLNVMYLMYTIMNTSLKLKERRYLALGQGACLQKQNVKLSLCLLRVVWCSTYFAARKKFTMKIEINKSLLL